MGGCWWAFFDVKICNKRTFGLFLYALELNSLRSLLYACLAANVARA
jgi:hypothetical protein